MSSSPGQRSGVQRETHHAQRHRVSSKRSNVASAPDTDEAAKAFGSNVGEVFKALSGLNLPLPALTQVQSDYLQQATELWNQSLQRLQAPPAANDAKAPAGIADRRFAAQDWLANPG